MAASYPARTCMPSADQPADARDAPFDQGRSAIAHVERAGERRRLRGQRLGLALGRVQSVADAGELGIRVRDGTLSTVVGSRMVDVAVRLGQRFESLESLGRSRAAARAPHRVRSAGGGRRPERPRERRPRHPQIREAP